jgi:hypothetical protein
MQSKEGVMPGPTEEQRRKAQVSSDTPVDKSAGRIVHEVNSSKRESDHVGKVEDPPSSTRARRPRSGRSGSDSSASGGTRGH